MLPIQTFPCRRKTGEKGGGLPQTPVASPVLLLELSAAARARARRAAVAVVFHDDGAAIQLLDAFDLVEVKGAV